MKTLTLTTADIYQRKQRLWKAYCGTLQAITRAFFPDTAGVSLYLHNWHKCGANKANANLAEWIESSVYARYRRLESKLCADNIEREHKLGKHSKRGFDPLWCPICNPKHARSYGLELRDGKWVKKG